MALYGNQADAKRIERHLENARLQRNAARQRELEQIQRQERERIREETRRIVREEMRRKG